MPRDVYRYAFKQGVPFAEAMATLELALIAVESMHGESRARLDGRFASDSNERVLVIDAATPVGQTLNQIFVGYARREFGEGAFTVTRCAGEPQALHIAEGL